uniref:Uncharacterized protein n=1 Tax=Plectus sambesii TaxID=2011161 RepID=A0A914WRN3_9BILA
MLLVGCVMLFIAVFGSVGNAIVVYVYGRNGKSRKQLFFIVNLAVLGTIGSLCYGIACYYIFSEKKMNSDGI